MTDTALDRQNLAGSGASASVAPGSPRAWLLASRPATLWAGAVPVLVGTACAAAAGGFRPGPALAALAGALLIQIGTNFANDVFDFEKGADTAARLGPTRAAQAGLLSPTQLRRGMGLAFALACGAGLYLTFIGGWPIVAIGIAAIISGVAYTGGPFPLGYHGLGDLFVLVFFGFVAVCGTAFVQLGAVPILAVWCAIPVGALATAVLVVNNLRDRGTDAQVGKRTLVVRFGRAGGLTEYAWLVLAAYVTPLAMVVFGVASAWVLLPLLTAPLAVRELRGVCSGDGQELNIRLKGTAQLLLAHGSALALGIALGG
jgi:1,4-dihydroxy-2-naphthoate polyprenyltransferase